MVADTARRPSSGDGLRPLSLARDWRQVLDLIEVAFGENLDAEARRALRGMRPPPLIAPLIGLLDKLAPPGEGMMPGFVWVQGGKVVGTASARRVHPMRHGWLISNVAVHPAFQGRGIGRALLEASLDFVADHGGAWVALQVRDDNRAARELYESLGFARIGQVIRWRHEVGQTVEAVTVAGLRPARWSEGRALFRLARTSVSHDMLWADSMNRSLYQTGLGNRLVNRLQGRRRRWWVKERQTGRLKAAIGVEVDRDNPWHRLRLLAPAEAQSEELATGLITFGLAQLADAPPLPCEIEHPASDEAVQAALVAVGFEPLYTLNHMRLDRSSNA